MSAMDWVLTNHDYHAIIDDSNEPYFEYVGSMTGKEPYCEACEMFCVSDALCNCCKVVAQAKRIAELEAELAKFQPCPDQAILRGFMHGDRNVYHKEGE